MGGLRTPMTSRYDPDAASRVCLGLWRYWRNGDHLGEGRECLDRMTAAPGDQPDELRARLLPLIAGQAPRSRPAGRRPST